MGLHLSVDNTAEIFGSVTSIADLAQFSFAGEDSQRLHIYRAEEIARTDWRDEIRDMEMEYATGISVTFNDGSKLHVAAWADCCDRTFYCDHCGQGALAA
ncbi:hypothetical protein [Novosphingobium guangzhouense]|uniref:Uncharacterized protein n=1 Tax=Novosphingobium guangzhouense TaxID=1850347 RepID=A0A2K2G449_9SPHN|nr:hypothetical protein [Novosphingobium guangzhouense]PNU05825.1 hypothetical protein A8V01_14770 [Novosphingobium guangzhouense]